MSLSDEFQKLKLAVVGTKTAQVDKQLDIAIDDIVSFKSQSGRNGYIDLVRSIVSKSTTDSISLDDKGIFSQTANPTAFGQGGRVMRYKMYESIVGNINYCFRALTVLTDNIMSPDDISKDSLEIQPTSFLEDEAPTEAKVKLVKEVVKRIKLEKHLDFIIRNMLMYGDFFVEIADIKTALTSRSYLAEVQQYLDNNTTGKETIFYKNEAEKIDLKINLHFEAEKKADDSEDALNNISMVFHNPGNIIKLQTDLFPLCFGYLAFPPAATMPHLQIKDQAVNDICRKILDKIGEKIPQIKEYSNNDELVNILKAMIKETDVTSVMNIRFIPPDRMQHFMVPSSKYYPYGESIFDSTVLTAKIFVALETALAVARLSRSTEKRKIAVEIGLPRDARKMIEKLKEEFRKRKISLDDFGTIDTIPSNITTFEDVYIPQKDGKPFVDISTFTEGNIDTRSKTDELKFLRDSVVASLGVPASFLNIEENLSNKNALSEESIQFARTIVNHQKYITNQLNELIEKVFYIVDPDEALTLLDNVQIRLPPPKSLQFEREARYMSELANLVETLERIGIPKEYTKKKYLTNIDWDDLKNYEADEKIDKTLGTETEEDDGLGGISTF